MRVAVVCLALLAGCNEPPTLNVCREWHVEKRQVVIPQSMDLGCIKIGFTSSCGGYNFGSWRIRDEEVRKCVRREEIPNPRYKGG